jgi:hypothetical protein
MEIPCIIILDSLKLHSKDSVAKIIREWLNYEWKRRGKGTKIIFTKSSIKAYAPEGITKYIYIYIYI